MFAWTVSLDLTGCRLLTWRSTVRIAQLRQLRELNLEGCSPEAVNDYVLGAIGGASVGIDAVDTAPGVSDGATVPTGCPELTSLWINCEDYEQVNISDDGVDGLTAGCRKLRLFSVSHAPLLTDAAVAMLGQRCRNLGAVRLVCCGDVGAGAIDNVVNLPPAEGDVLQRDDLDMDATHVGLGGLFAGCKRLTELELWGSARINDAVLDKLGKHCPQLLRLTVAGSQQITDDGLIGLGLGCPLLVALTMPHCQGGGLTDVGVSSIATSCRGLVELNVAACAITDSTLWCLGAFCPRLTYLDARSCRITDDGLKELARGCRQLEHLRIGGRANGFVPITDIGLFHLAVCCSQLRSLDLRECDEWLDTAAGTLFTEHGLQMLQKKCPRLVELLVSVRSIHGVRDVIVDDLDLQCPCSRDGILATETNSLTRDEHPPLLVVSTSTCGAWLEMRVALERKISNDQHDNRHHCNDDRWWASCRGLHRRLHFCVAVLMMIRQHNPSWIHRIDCGTVITAPLCRADDERRMITDAARRVAKMDVFVTWGDCVSGKHLLDLSFLETMV